MTGTVRIIGGRWRRSRLPVPTVTGLRPTPDRVRETLFNWVADRVVGARCLDLYAGTGALGLEAASRGASRVVAVERDRLLTGALREQCERLGASDVVDVVEAPVESWLARGGAPFDLAFIDPPYDQQAEDRIAALLERHGWLAPGALVYLEGSRPFSALELPASWRMLRSNKAGQVRYHLAAVDQVGGDTGGGAQ